MTQSVQVSDYWSLSMSKRFWAVASLFYVGALLTHFVFVWGDECGFTFIPAPQPIFVGMISVLLVFEWEAYRRYRGNLTRRAGVGLLVAHMVLFELTSAVDCAATTTFLYLLIPFFAYMIFNMRVAIGLALLYSVWFATYFQVFRDDPLEDYIFRTVVFVLGMLLGVAMASIVKGVLDGQVEERRLHTELEEAHSQLEAYAARVKQLGAIEERNRLARDIHDGVGHYLAAVTVQLEKAMAFRSSDPSTSERAIVDARQAAQDALRDVRRSVGALRQPEEFSSLTNEIEKLVGRASSDRLDIELTVDGDELGYPNSVLMSLYRVAQEGLTNVQRHAAARNVKITLRLDEDSAKLTVHDDGKGFNVSAIGWKSPSHQGLRGMRERLELVGGHMTVESNTEMGTKLIAVVPKHEQTLSEEFDEPTI